MSKLNRYGQKIFGSLAGINQISKFGSLFAGTPEFTTDPGQAMSLSNFLTGWLGGAIGGNAPAIEDMNALHFITTYQLAYMMQQGVAEWDAATTYYKGSLVNVAGVLYKSVADDNLNNVTSDTAYWRPYSTEMTGVGKDYWGATLPSGGYVWADGKTIGNAASNATGRANVDTEDLFTLLWNSTSNTELPIYNSAGVASIRGASAAADYAANKALTVPDKRGRVSVGKDDLGGTAANRVTTANGLNGTILANAGGEQVHSLVVSEIPSHTHNFTVTRIPATTGQNCQAGPDIVALGANAFSGTTDNGTGGNGTHNNMQPSIICNYIIKL